MQEDTSSDARPRVLALLRAHGRHATSFQILEQGFRYWFSDDGAAVVAYVDTWGWWVAAAAPIAPVERVGEVAAHFVAAARASGRRAAFFSVDAQFVESLRGFGAAPPFDALKIGEQPEWEPSGYDLQGREMRSLRAQVNRASNKGVSARRVPPEEVARSMGALRAQIQVVLDRWLESRQMSAMSFMVDLQPFSFPAERRYYVAEQGDQLVGFLAAIPVYGRRGWFFEDVIRVPDAPNGTTELLIHTALEEARQAGDGYVTLGLAPLSGIETGPGSKRWLRRGLRACYDHLGPLYSFPGLRAFKARFRPQRWSSQWLVVSPPPLGVRAFQAVLSAFAGGGLVAFGLDTASRGLGRVPLRFWARALVGFAALLVPWTLLLALADGRRWFGDVSIQWAWVAFDAAMVLALASLAGVVGRGRSWARGLAVFLAGATLTDFLLTTVQAMHLHQEARGWAALFIAAGMAGPLLATTFLGTLALTAPLPRSRGRGRRRLH